MFGGFAKHFGLAKQAEKRTGTAAVKASPSALRGAGVNSFSQIPREKPKASSTAFGRAQRKGNKSSIGSGRTAGENLPAEANEKLNEYLEDAVKNSTKKTYQSYWRRFKSFCEEKSLVIQDAKSISLFLIQLAERSENRVSALTAKHAIKYHLKLLHPCKKAGTDTYLVSRIVKSISKKWGKPVSKAKEITSDLVSKMVFNLLSSGTFKNERTAIFILLQFICMGRYEEVAKLEKTCIEIVPPGHLKILFPSAKNYEKWDAQTSWVSGNKEGTIDPVQLVRDYMKKLSSQVKWLFPSFRLGKGQVPVFLDKAVSYSNQLNLLKSALSAIGENGDEFSLHGLRTGSLSEVANSCRNVPRADIRRHGRWKSQEMVDHYHKLSLEKKLAPSKALRLYEN